ncbi:MAG: hypothetical protein KC609_03085 [Myxococcales bacterium]|nr:hypothetical protein [Myxococcales bacterium]
MRNHGRHLLPILALGLLAPFGLPQGQAAPSAPNLRLTLALQVGVARIQGVVTLRQLAGSLSKQRRWQIAGLQLRVERGPSQVLELRGTKSSGLTMARNGKPMPKRPTKPGARDPIFDDALLLFPIAAWPLTELNGRNPLLQLTPPPLVELLALLVPRQPEGPLSAPQLAKLRSIASLRGSTGVRRLGSWRFSKLESHVAPCGGLGCERRVRFVAQPDPAPTQLAPERVLRVTGDLTIRDGIGWLRSAKLRLSGSLWIGGSARVVRGTLSISSGTAP